MYLFHHLSMGYINLVTVYVCVCIGVNVSNSSAQCVVHQFVNSKLKSPASSEFNYEKERVYCLT